MQKTAEGKNVWDLGDDEDGLPGVTKARMSHIYKRLDSSKPAYTVTGSGGGGRDRQGGTGSGGSGIVILRAPGSAQISATPGTNTISTLPAPAGGCKVATFTVSGTLIAQ